jgi:hypothetical protein
MPPSRRVRLANAVGKTVSAQKGNGTVIPSRLLVRSRTPTGDDAERSNCHDSYYIVLLVSELYESRSSETSNNSLLYTGSEIADPTCRCPQRSEIGSNLVSTFAQSVILLTMLANRASICKLYRRTDYIQQDRYHIRTLEAYLFEGHKERIKTAVIRKEMSYHGLSISASTCDCPKTGAAKMRCDDLRSCTTIVLRTSNIQTILGLETSLAEPIEHMLQFCTCVLRQKTLDTTIVWSGA